MPDKTMPPPRYGLWQAIAVCLGLARRALDEVRELARSGGKPGPAGLGFDDLSVEFDGRHTVTLRFARGEQVREFPIVFRNMYYCNVFDDTQRYEPGDTVTFGGSLWHCNETTSDRPKENTQAWTLCAKAGRDGRAGRDGAKGDPGPDGRPGRNFTELGARL